MQTQMPVNLYSYWPAAIWADGRSSLTSRPMRCCCSTSMPRRPFADGAPVVRHSLSRKLTVGAALDGASLNANTELNRPFQITGTSALGHLTFIVSLSSISLFNHDTGQTIGSIPWK